MAKRKLTDSVVVGKPRVTLFADASYHQRTGAAGWGAWIKADGQDPIVAGGPMKRPFTQSNQAELAAIANALWHANDVGALKSGDVIMVQSDCTHALHVLLWYVRGTSHRPIKDGVPIPATRIKIAHREHECLAVINSLVKSCPMTLIVRHVRGHQKGEAGKRGRGWVNREVDHIARRGMRAHRDTLEVAADAKPSA